MLVRLLPALVLAIPVALQAQQIGAGHYFSMALCDDQMLQNWGSNAYGQLGDSTLTAHSVAAAVPDLGALVDMQGGHGHTVALAADSTVWCWGRNEFGGLGNGTTVGSLVPLQVPALSGVVAIAAGDFFSAALRADGTLWTWGHNNYGQLGNGSLDNYIPYPVAVSMAGITAVALSNGSTHVLRADGTVWSWGLNDRSQLGSGDDLPAIVRTPVQAFGLTDVVAISASRYYFATALRADGTVWAWGDNMFGQMGNGTTTRNDVPAQVPGLSDIVAIPHQSGQGHTAALRADGTLWMWGYNMKGELGNGTNDDSTTPVQVSDIADVVAVTCGMNHTLALKADGTAWAWGLNSSGELGNGTIINSNLPVPVTGVCISTGVPEGLDAQEPTTVFPNPTNGIVHLGLSPKPGRTGSVLNALGARVQDLNAAQLNGSQAIDISGLPAGIYLLRIKDADRLITARVVLQ